MQTLKSVLVITVIFGAVFLVGRLSSSSKSKNDVSGDANKVCYVWNTEAGDKGLLVMNINGEQVNGTLDIAIAEKDKKSGSISGQLISLNSDPKVTMLDAVWDNMQEGVQNKEQLWVKINGSVASPAFGEMKDGGKGVYVYANPDKVSFDINLQEAPCEVIK